MAGHGDAIFVTNKLVRTLGETHLKVLKEKFLQSEEKKLDFPQFEAAVHSTLYEWAHEHARSGGFFSDGMEADKVDKGVIVERQMKIIMKNFTGQRLYNLFNHLDCDKDGKVDWMDMSTLMVEGAAIKTTIKQYQERPETSTWSVGEVDKVLYIEQWRKMVLCMQSKVVYVYTITGKKYAEFVGHRSIVLSAAYLAAINRLATSSTDSTVIIWDERQRTILKQIPFPQPILSMVSVTLDSGRFLYVGGLEKCLKGYDIDKLMKWTPPTNVPDDNAMPPYLSTSKLQEERPPSPTTTLKGSHGRRRVAGGAIVMDPVEPPEDEGRKSVTPKKKSTRTRDKARGPSASPVTPPTGGLDDTPSERAESRASPAGKNAKSGVLSSSDDETSPRRGRVAKLHKLRKSNRNANDTMGSQGQGQAPGCSDPRKYPQPCVRFTTSHDDWITDMVIIADLRLVVTASLDKTVRVWDLFTGDVRYKKVGHTKGVLSLCYIEEFRLVLSSGYGKEVLVWNPLTPNPALATLVGHEKQVLGVCNIPNTPTCLSMDVTGRLIVWDIRSYAQVQSVGGLLSKFYVGPTTCYCLELREGQLISIGHNSISHYRPRESAHMHKMKRPIHKVLFDAKKQLMVLTSGHKFYTYSSVDGRLRIANERISQTDITSICWCSQDCSQVAVGNMDGKVKIVCTETGQVTAFRASVYMGVAALFRVLKFSQDQEQLLGVKAESKMLLILSLKGQVVIINHTRENHERPMLRHQTHVGGPSRPDWTITHSCYSVTDNVLVVFAVRDDAETSEMCVEAWNLNNVDSVLFADKVSKPVTAVCITDERSCMLTCNVSGELWIWNTHNLALMVVMQLDMVHTLVSKTDEEGEDRQVECESPFVATSISFSESRLAILIADEKRVKAVSFNRIANQFFDLHKDASWNLINVPNDAELYKNRFIIEKKLYRGECEDMVGHDLRFDKKVVLTAVESLAEYQKEVEIHTALAKGGSEGVYKLFDHWTEEKDVGPGPGRSKVGQKMERKFSARLVLPSCKTTLWEAFRQETVSSVEVPRIVEGVVKGLMELHRAGYTHTACIPKNIAEFEKGWKITDLACCYKTGADLPVDFTPYYCPPEMAHKRRTGERLVAQPHYDMWIFGILLCEIVLGERFFSVFETDEPDAILEILEGIECNDELLGRIASRVARVALKEPVLSEIAEAVLKVNPDERASSEWCFKNLSEQQYIKDATAGAIEVRPFPKTVPLGVTVLRVNECDLATDDEDTFFKTSSTPCANISTMFVNDDPSAVFLGDYDKFSNLALLRAYNLNMEYHGRLPTNDYDDTDTNWNFPYKVFGVGREDERLRQQQQQQQSQGQKSRQRSLKAADVSGPASSRVPRRSIASAPTGGQGLESWMNQTPAELLKTHSWRDLRRRMQDISDSTTKKSKARPKDLEMCAEISPFFSEWQRSGVVYEPINQFYCKAPTKDGKKVQLPKVKKVKVERRGREGPSVRNDGPVGRDVDFIRSLPRTLDSANQQSTKLRKKRERCFCGRSVTGKDLQNVIKQVGVKLVTREGAVMDAAVWVQPPRTTLGLNTSGDKTEWIEEADKLLGMGPTLCCNGHRMTKYRTYVEAVECDGCTNFYPCCTQMHFCARCSYHLCEQCTKPKTEVTPDRQHLR